MLLLVMIPQSSTMLGARKAPSKDRLEGASIWDYLCLTGILSELTRHQFTYDILWHSKTPLLTQSKCSITAQHLIHTNRDNDATNHLRSFKLYSIQPTCIQQWLTMTWIRYLVDLWRFLNDPMMGPHSQGSSHQDFIHWITGGVQVWPAKIEIIRPYTKVGQ